MFLLGANFPGGANARFKSRPLIVSSDWHASLIYVNFLYLCSTLAWRVFFNSLFGYSVVMSTAVVSPLRACKTFAIHIPMRRLKTPHKFHTLLNALSVYIGNSKDIASFTKSSISLCNISSLKLFKTSAHSILAFISKIDNVSYVTKLLQWCNSLLIKACSFVMLSIIMLLFYNTRFLIR